MEMVHSDSIPQNQETLISDPLNPRVSECENDGNKDKSLVIMQDESSVPNETECEEFGAESMVCDASSRLVPGGFSRSNYKDEVIMFINAGCEAFRQEDSEVKFIADAYYQGGDVLRTNESMIEGGDYPFIYQSARLGSFTYEFNNLAPGDYFVDLHFVEIINTNGPKGMRVFDVFIQEEKVLSDFDIFAIVGANKPLRLVDSRVSVGEGGVLVIKFVGILGSAMVSGICIRRAPKLSDTHLAHDYLRCNNCSAEIEVLSNLDKGMRLKSTAKYEKKIEELSLQCQRKTDECYQAWMSLTATTEQLQKVRMELDNRLFQTYSLDKTVETQTEKLRVVSDLYDHDKKRWIKAIADLERKIKIMKKEHHQLALEAHECADSIPELNEMVAAVQILVAQCDDLKLKYVEEQKQRKKLFNEVQEAKGNIRVFCRCRPLNKKEQSAGHATVIDFEGAKDGEVAVLTGGSTKKTFRFDRVYTPKDDQVDVFADASPMAVSVLDGYNVCIFAYGQTGTGKTFTMEGTEENRGVNYRTLEQLFRIATERRQDFKYNISVTVLEVYNEQIRDLLDASPMQKKLEIKQGSEGFHHVPGIVEAKVESIKQVWDVLKAGSNARAVGSNNVNEHSSRSHCLLCVHVKAENLINGECTKSKLWLVDLAGSERLAKTDVQGERLKEAQNINRSLSALGDVIAALANKSSHIPYRNSRLTHLLQDSLGGDSKTLMFVQISPSEQDIGETLSSLNFASRVRGIDLAPAKRQIDTSELQKTKMMLDKARQESRAKDECIKKLEGSLQSLENKARSKDQTSKYQQEKINELENQLESKTTLYNRTEKELREWLKGREEICTSLQSQVKELEDKLREQKQSDPVVLQPIRDLDRNLEEESLESDACCGILQQRIKELEEKLKEQEQNDHSTLLLQKVKELEKKLREKEQQTRVDTMNELDHYIPKTGATPTTGRPSLRDETMSDIEPRVLKCSNSSKRMSYGSTLLKGQEVSNELRRKREFRSSETENNAPMPAPLHDKKIRKSDPPLRPFSSRLTQQTKSMAAAQTRTVNQNKINRDHHHHLPSAKDKDTKKRMWF